MLRLVRRMRRDESGFTLVELLVVAAILALLAGIAIPAVANARNTARDNAQLANEAIITAALERYYIAHSAYPTDSFAPADTDYATVSAAFVEDLDLKNATQLLDKYEITYTYDSSAGTYTLVDVVEK